MIEELLVPMQPIDQQRAFVELDRLQVEAQELADQFYEKRMKLLVGWVQRGTDQTAESDGISRTSSDFCESLPIAARTLPSLLIGHHEREHRLPVVNLHLQA